MNKQVQDPAGRRFEELVDAATEPREVEVMVAPLAVQDTLNSFRHFDANELRIQLEWVAQGRARLLVNGTPLLSDAGLPLTLFTSARRAVKSAERPQSVAA